MSKSSEILFSNLTILGVGLLLLVLPAFDLTTIDVLLIFVTYAVLAVSWNWACGLGGLLNLAHLAFYAIGSYSCAIAVAKLGIHPLYGIVVGIIAALALAFLMSYLSFRLKVSQLYFALFTLIAAEAMMEISRGVEHEFSLGGIYLPFGQNPLWLQFIDKSYYYYLIAAFLVLMILAQNLVMRGKWGLLIAASRDSEQAAASLGVPVGRVLTLVTMASAVPPAILGSILALSSLFVTVDNLFAFELLLVTIMATVIGGLGTLWGPVVGALTITLVQEGIRASIGGGHVGVSDIVYGALLIFIVVAFPAGVVGITKWFSASLSTTSVAGRLKDG